MVTVEQAKKWWAQWVNEQPVWRTGDMPQGFKEILLGLNLAYQVRRDIIVLGKPETELPTLVCTYFWEIVSCILRPYSPYVITGITALLFYLDEKNIPEKLHVFTKSSSTQINIQQISTLVLEKKPTIEETRFKEVKIRPNYSLMIEAAESLLLSLHARHFRDFPHIISSFLKIVPFNMEILSDLLLQKSKPITYLRLAYLFEQIGKNQEANLIRNCLKATLNYKAPGKMQILKQTMPFFSSATQLSDPAHVMRFRDQLRSYREHIERDLQGISLPSWSLDKIKEYAEKTKKYDTYHSSTIEGYRVTNEEIQMLIDGRNAVSLGKNREDIERKMALKGYLAAHQFVLKNIEEHFLHKKPFTEQVIREIYAHLFLPSVEAGILEKEQLIQYRNDAVYIRHSRYVPVNHLKVSELMRCLVEETNDIINPTTQAIIAHYGFVTIHPYFDGNGRVARLLMNYLLNRQGIPWITIRIEDRDRYFKALEIAQCDENILPLTEFLKSYFEESLLFI